MLHGDGQLAYKRTTRVCSLRDTTHIQVIAKSAITRLIKTEFTFPSRSFSVMSADVTVSNAVAIWKLIGAFRSYKHLPSSFTVER